jgi:hypothetical protein
MGSIRFTFRRGMRPGAIRGAGAACLALVLAAILAGCAGGAARDREKAADVAALNSALAAELTGIDAYGHGVSLLSGRLRAVAWEFLAQEKEDVDALTKAIRGLGGETDAEKARRGFSEASSAADFLKLAYELESAALATYLDEARRLFSPAPRGLAVSLAAGHAQRLVVLRQGLGAGLAAAVPEAFDSGDVPPPGRGGSPSGAR